MRSDLSRSRRNKKSYKIRAFAEKHSGKLKTAVVIFVVIAAFLFFSMYGENDEIVLREAGSAEQSSVSASSQENDSAETADTVEEVNILYVDIAGEVNSPGVYAMPAGSRVFEVIEKAGGLTSDADVTRLNRAGTVVDGEKIIVPSVNDSGAFVSDESLTSGTGNVVNINTAGEEELQTLKGIGPSTAKKIIEYREINGPFDSTEDIMNISGIGSKTFEKIKDQIVAW